MFRSVALGILIGGMSFARADEKADSAIKDLHGQWKVEKMISRGETIKPEKLTFTFKGNELIASDNPKDVATIKLDPTKKPAWIETTPATRGCATTTSSWGSCSAA